MKLGYLPAFVLAFALAALAAVDLGDRSDVPSYLTAPVARGDLVTAVTATGTLNAVVTVRVGSQLSGQIQELLVDFNDEVRRGQPIASLDPQTFAARVREAAAALDVARATVLIQEAAIGHARADLANARAGHTAPTPSSRAPRRGAPTPGASWRASGSCASAATSPSARSTGP